MNMFYLHTFSQWSFSQWGWWFTILGNSTYLLWNGALLGRLNLNHHLIYHLVGGLQICEPFPGFSEAGRSFRPDGRHLRHPKTFGGWCGCQHLHVSIYLLMVSSKVWHKADSSFTSLQYGTGRLDSNTCIQLSLYDFMIIYVKLGEWCILKHMSFYMIFQLFDQFTRLVNALMPFAMCLAGGQVLGCRHHEVIVSFDGNEIFCSGVFCGVF